MLHRLPSTFFAVWSRLPLTVRAFAAQNKSAFLVTAAVFAVVIPAIQFTGPPCEAIADVVAPITPVWDVAAMAVGSSALAWEAKGDGADAISAALLLGSISARMLT